jgi:hypothetical protein
LLGLRNKPFFQAGPALAGTGQKIVYSCPAKAYNALGLQLAGGDIIAKLFVRCGATASRAGQSAGLICAIFGGNEVPFLDLSFSFGEVR